MRYLLTFLLSVVLYIPVLAFDKVENPQKPRLVVMTDIGDCDVEPDDMQLVRRR